MDRERTRQNSYGIRKERKSQDKKESEDDKDVFAVLNMALR